MASTRQTQDFSQLCMQSALKASQCATSCLEQEDPSLNDCIKTCLDYAHIAEATGTLMARGSEYARRMAQICADVAVRCAQHCEQHADGRQVVMDCASLCRQVAEAGEAVAMQQNP